MKSLVNSTKEPHEMYIAHVYLNNIFIACGYCHRIHECARIMVLGTKL